MNCLGQRIAIILTAHQHISSSWGYSVLHASNVCNNHNKSNVQFRFIGKMKSITIVILLVACYLSMEFSVGQAAANRERRDIQDDMKKQLKEYSESIGKTPEETKAAITNFLEGQGLTIVDVHKTFLQGGDAAKQMMQNMKNAIAG
ncbi:unnamed protein product [Orchesella dallaii]|uniref:Uncharacterized protein n=1 Tax=Orchesella dallaii TaxID=48710 RepID=A0ABP1Q1N6_9HEXA